ncbi:MAG: GNAT family N-acetyltransferase [Burkholderiaceae bacterium]
MKVELVPITPDIRAACAENPKNEIAPAFRNKGYATGAVHLILERAFQHAAVQSVVAHTLPEKNASNAVLSKSKFVFERVVDHGADGSVWRWVRSNRT